MYLFLLSLSGLLAQEAEATESAGSTSLFGSPLVMFALIIAVFYFLMIRPQQKQRARHEDFLKNLKRGDEVVTSSGIMGVVDSISDNVVNLQIDDNVKIKVLKGTVSSSTQPAAQKK